MSPSEGADPVVAHLTRLTVLLASQQRELDFMNEVIGRMPRERLQARLGAARSRNTVMATIAADARELLTDDAPT